MVRVPKRAESKQIRKQKDQKMYKRNSKVDKVNSEKWEDLNRIGKGIPTIPTSLQNWIALYPSEASSR
jgi:hypothetical protein